MSPRPAVSFPASGTWGQAQGCDPQREGLWHGLLVQTLLGTFPTSAGRLEQPSPTRPVPIRALAAQLWSQLCIPAVSGTEPGEKRYLWQKRALAGI